MTVGYLFDLLIINEVRKEKLAEKLDTNALDTNVKNDLDKQNGHLLREIGRYMIEVSAGKRPGMFAKHKSYDKEVSELPIENLIKVIYKLYQRHTELWELEDIRRDKSIDDHVRLSAADKVSVTNKKRNDLVEMIDNIINNSLKQTNLWGNLL